MRRCALCGVCLRIGLAASVVCKRCVSYRIAGGDMEDGATIVAESWIVMVVKKCEYS